MSQTLTDNDKLNAMSNSGYGSYKFGSRTFELKHLAYDDYMKFVKLAQPLIETIAQMAGEDLSGGVTQIAFNAMALDFDTVIKLSGDNLPQLAWLALKASDPKIKPEEVKALAVESNPGCPPMAMAEVVLVQVKHNQMIKGFVDFFQRLATRVADLMPEVTQAMTPVPATTTPTA